jgi:hypothetical protein
MNRNDFNRIMNNTGSVDRQMVGEVRELLDMFPYFQSAHLLLLKGLHNISDLRFESQLRQSAIYVADREVLYHLLNRETQTTPEQPESTVQPEQPESTVQPEQPEQGKQVYISEAFSPDSQQTVIESGKNSEELINEFYSSGPMHSVLVNEESDEDDSGSIVFLLDNEDEQEDEKITYMDPSIYVPVQDDLLELDLQAGISAESEESPVPVKSKKHEQADLIDKFIIANPRIEPVRDKSDTPAEDMSRSLTEEKGSFITETLAKIYVNQGYYSKAIEIYERLSLKFPEKSSYFATQIEKVREQIK